MRTSLLRRAMPLSLVAVFASAWLANAGDLDPPAGPIGPTMKTLDEVEPRIAINATNTPGDANSLFKITLPGSYYLSGNITGVVGKHGIEIVTSGVSLDLNGFDLVGVSGSLDAVSVTAANQTNIVVVNGSIRNWGDEGVDLSGFSATNCRVAEVLASGNTGIGISAGIGGTVTSCSATSNAGMGITAGMGSAISICSASSNTGNGINTAVGCTVTNCSVTQNGSNGISTASGCTVADCTSAFNLLDGIVCDSQCIIRGSTCSSNGNGAGNGAGVHATGNDNRIEGNNCTLADRGIDVDLGGNFITRNICSGNTTNNWDIVAGNVCLVVQGVPGAAILGNTGGAAPGSTDPNANFTY